MKYRFSIQNLNAECISDFLQSITELQIRRGIDDNSKIIFLISQ